MGSDIVVAVRLERRLQDLQDLCQLARWYRPVFSNRRHADRTYKVRDDAVIDPHIEASKQLPRRDLRRADEILVAKLDETLTDHRAVVARGSHAVHPMARIE